MAEDRDVRNKAVAKLAAREGTQPYAQHPMEQATRRASTAVKAFDIKEHWTALGLLASLALALSLEFWDPRTDGPALKPT